MNGRQKIEAAFSAAGTGEIPALTSYWDITIRDHWDELTGCPWWYRFSPQLEEQLAWQREAIPRPGHDWFYLPFGASRAERARTIIEAGPEGVALIDRETLAATRLERPAPGGHWELPPPPQPESADEIERLVPVPPPFDPAGFRAEGRGELAETLLAEFGAEYYPIYNTNSPVWGCYSLWDCAGWMRRIATQPELVRLASERFLAQRIRLVREAAALGAAAIWIDECMMDQVSPAQFGALNVPILGQLMDEIRAAGMKSIYYFCGNPEGKWNQILDIGADALAFEEGKKGFEIDVVRVAGIVRGRCALLGNLDALGILQDGSDEDLRREIARQIGAARLSGGRFIMCLGSPVTPATPIARVRRYCELAHELGDG